MIDFEAYLDAIKPLTTRPPPADHVDFVRLRDLASDVYTQFAVGRGIALLPNQTSPSHFTATPCL